MDIVNLSQKKRHKRHRNPERRHTTEVRFNPELLDNDGALSRSDKNTSDIVVDSCHYKKQLDVPKRPVEPLSSSWNSLFDIGDFESPPDTEYHYFEGSQANTFSVNEPRGKYDISKHQYQLSYELALDNVLTPFVDSGPADKSPLVFSRRRSHMDHVIHELRSTERVYIEDLSQVVDEYQVPLVSHVGVLPVKESDLEELFGNVREILLFHRTLMCSLEASGNDPKKIALCFLSNAEGFKIYTHYCNNYPKSVNILTQLSQDVGVSLFLKRCQQRLNHKLPLGAYLLKPVQRVLKYSLLLADMLKNIRSEEPVHDILKDAIREMTAVAEHINAMKKKYDAAVHVQELQSLIRGNEGLDLSKYGDLIQEENFRYSGSRSTGSTFRGKTDRYVFLFERLCLITKKEELGYQYKAHLEIKDLQLTEKVEKDLNSFHIRQVSTGRSYTFQSRSLEQKNQWVHAIKLQLMESLPDLPDKAKEMILKGFPAASEAEDSPSPRSRHRHHSEEPILPSRISSKVEAMTRYKSRTLGHGVQAGAVYSGENERGPSSTTSIQKFNQSSVTLAQTTLTGLLSVSIFEADAEDNSEKHLFGSLDDGGLVESHGGPHDDKYPGTSDKQAGLTSRHKSRHKSPAPEPECQLPLKKTLRSSSSPQLSHHNSVRAYQANKPSIIFPDNTCKENENTTVEFEIACTNFVSELPEVEVVIEQDQQEVHEALFEELMSSNLDMPSLVNDSYDPCADSTPTETEQPLDLLALSSPELLKETLKCSPLVTPSSIQQCSVAKCSSYDPDGQPTPKPSPLVQRCAIATGTEMSLSHRQCYTDEEVVPFSSSVVRRHSLCSDARRVEARHKKQGSVSNDNTPSSSPRFKGNRKSWKESNHQSVSSEVPEMSMVELVSTTRADSLEDMSNNDERKSIILTPPCEFLHDTKFNSPIKVPYNLAPVCVVDSPLTGSKELISYNERVSIHQSNPEEMLTFDEVLQSYDHYSSASGHTNKSSHHHVSTPDLILKRKKKRNRSLTVANIDTHTMNQVKVEIAANRCERKHDDSKVRKLAREYSQRMKENDRSHSRRRFSQVVEEDPFVNTDYNRKEPQWLQKLKENTKSLPGEKFSSGSGSESTITAVDLGKDSYEQGYDTIIVKKGGLRGWVQSLVDKFSVNKTTQ